MLEVHVKVTLFGESCKTLGKGIEFRRRIAAVPSQPVAGVSRSGMHLRGQQVIALRDAKRGVVLPKDRVDLVDEPRFVPELERDHGSIRCLERWSSKKAAE